jgi:hypothetical protein
MKLKFDADLPKLRRVAELFLTETLSRDHVCDAMPTWVCRQPALEQPRHRIFIFGN